MKIKILYILLLILLCCSISAIYFLNKKTTQIRYLQSEVSDKKNEIEKLKSKVSELEEANDKLLAEQKTLKLQNDLNEISNKRIQQNLSTDNFFQGDNNSRNGATVVFRKSGCDYFILENDMGFIIAEWMGGHDPNTGEILYGDFHSFGTKDFYNTQNTNCRLWIDDYMLSKDNALEKINDKCN